MISVSGWTNSFCAAKKEESCIYVHSKQISKSNFSRILWSFVWQSEQTINSLSSEGLIRLVFFRTLTIIFGKNISDSFAHLWIVSNWHSNGVIFTVSLFWTAYGPSEVLFSSENYYMYFLSQVEWVEHYGQNQVTSITEKATNVRSSISRFDFFAFIQFFWSNSYEKLFCSKGASLLAFKFYCFWAFSISFLHYLTVIVMLLPFAFSHFYFRWIFFFARLIWPCIVCVFVVSNGPIGKRVVGPSLLLVFRVVNWLAVNLQIIFE